MARKPPTRSWKSVPAPSVSDTICGDDPTPPAAVSLLIAADATPVQVGAMLYASPGLCFDGNLTGYLQRRFGVVVPVACKRSRLYVTRCGSDPIPQITKQAAHLHGSTTGGGYAGNALSVSQSPATGDEVYLQTHATKPLTSCAIGVTGSQVNDAPTAQLDRALLTPEGLAPAVEVYQVDRAAGVSVQFWSRTDDLETL